LNGRRNGDRTQISTFRYCHWSLCFTFGIASYDSPNYSHRLRLRGCMFIPGNVPNPTRAISSMQLALIPIQY
jgi:hypothetical protein